MIRAQNSLLRQTQWHLGFIRQQFGWLVGAGIWQFLVGFLSGRQILEQSSTLALPAPQLGDGLFLVFAGPPLGSSSFVPLLIWLASIVFFLMLIGDLANRQFTQQEYMIVLRVGSRRVWWIGIVLTIVLTAVGYVSVILTAAVGGLAAQLSWHTEPSSFFATQGIWQAVAALSFVEVTVTIFSLFTSSLVVMGLLQTLVALRTRRAIWGFFVILTLALIAWLAGSGDDAHSWQAWFPGTQSILSRHWPFEPRLPEFTMPMSLAYNTALILTLALIGFLLMRSFDFLGADHDE